MTYLWVQKGKSGQAAAETPAGNWREGTLGVGALRATPRVGSMVLSQSG